jgi:hypothetical protein
MDPNIALLPLLNAIEAQDVEAFWLTLSDLDEASATTGKLPVMPELRHRETASLTNSQTGQSFPVTVHLPSGTMMTEDGKVVPRRP